MTEIRLGDVQLGDHNVRVIEIWQDIQDSNGQVIKTLTVMVPVEQGEIISVVL